MGNRYYGDFRSVDTSVDPKGQLYRVVIFTGYNGSNPYEFQDIMQGEQYIGRVPINNTAITMAENPFTVSYEGDTGNIYKPYICSTASVSFRQSDINLDFLSSNGTSTLVVLLKWKNTVSEVNSHMYDSETGATLYKNLVQETGVNPIVWYNDYNPDSYDRFCYSVEWVGYSTPETFSMDYSHTTDTFTLNCQDAFSTLQYHKYNWLGQDSNTVVSFQSLLSDFLKGLGTYRKLYVTDTVRFPDVSANILSKVYEQQRNNYDEDRKPTDKLEVLTQILTYLNLTAIPWQNNLIITTPNAIADGWNNYYVYELPYNGYIVNWPQDNADYVAMPQEYLNNPYSITESSFAEGGTTISTENIYNSVKVECDEYEVEMMLPDIEDPKNLSNHYYHYDCGEFLRSGDDIQRWYWEHDFWSVDVEKMKTYQYVGNSYNDSWNTAEKDTPDYSSDTNGIYYCPTCAILDDGGHTYSSSQADGLSKPYSPTRKIYFRTPSYNSTRSNVVSNWQTLLYAKTESVVITGNHYLQITGDWTFYNSTVWAFKCMPTINEIDHMGTSTRNDSCCYIKAKVKCCGKWLSNTGNNYTWVDNETTVNLQLQPDATQNAFGVPVSFRNTYRNYSGIVVKLPIEGDDAAIGQVEIWLTRPLGVSADYLCETATLTGFEFNVIAEKDLEKRHTNETNTEYKTEMDESAVKEYNTIKLNLSSEKEKGIRFSQTIRNGYKVMPNVYNVATGNFHLPEQHITSNIANQYSTPTVNLQMTIHYGLTPYSLVTWSKMSGKKFVVSSTEIDYEYDRQTVTLVEVKPITERTTKRNDKTRNYRRNQDLINNDNQVAQLNTVTLTNPDTGINGTFQTTYNGYLHYIIPSGGTMEQTANVTLQPDFANCTIQVSIPNDLTEEMTVSTNNNGQLVITTI